MSAASVTAPAGTRIVTSLSASSFGVIVTTYSLAPLLPDAKIAVASPSTVRSLAAKPFTASENLMVKSNAAFCSVVGSAIMVTVGTIVSICTVYASEAVLLFSALSFAAPAGTWIGTSPSASVLGVIVTTYSLSPALPDFKLAMA